MTARRRRTSLPVVLAGLASAAALLLPAAEPRPVGLAISDYPFQIESWPVRGNGTILAGEQVSAKHLPLRLVVGDDVRLKLGIGSGLRVEPDRLILRGVSLEIEDAGAAPPAVECGGLQFVLSPGGRAVLYSDQLDSVSVWVEEGVLTVSAFRGEPATLEAGEAGTFAEVLGGVVSDSNRPALEIGRIQARQLKYLGELDSFRPAIGEARQRLLRSLVEASDGLIEAEPGIQTRVGRGAAAALNTVEVLAVTWAVHAEIHTRDWFGAGCGAPDCARFDPVRDPNDLHGYAGGLRLGSALCELCQAATTEE